jgi:hypothetical protein
MKHKTEETCFFLSGLTGFALFHSSFTSDGSLTLTSALAFWHRFFFLTDSRLKLKYQLILSSQNSWTHITWWGAHSRIVNRNFGCCVSLSRVNATIQLLIDCSPIDNFCLKIEIPQNKKLRPLPDCNRFVTLTSSQVHFLSGNDCYYISKTCLFVHFLINGLYFVRYLLAQTLVLIKTNSYND